MTPSVPGEDSTEEAASHMLTVDHVASLLHCSVKHVQRMSETGLMPPPVKLGSLVRWPRSIVNAWIADGCRPQDSTKP